MQNIKKPHLSASQLRTFSKCEAQWYFRYVLYIKTIPSAFLTLGKSFDGAINHNFEQKLKTRLDLKADVVADVFSTIFKELESETDFLGDTPENVREVGIKLIKKYHSVASPVIMPKLIQPEFEIGFENTEWTFVAKPDLITEKNLIIENKTSARTPSWITADDLIQLHSYEISVSEHMKPMPSKIIYAIKKAEPNIVAFDTPKITGQDKKHWQYLTSMTFQRQQLIRLASTGSLEGIAPKTNRQHFLCSKRFCGYWSECEKLFGGKVKQ